MPLHGLDNQPVTSLQEIKLGPPILLTYARRGRKGRKALEKSQLVMMTEGLLENSLIKFVRIGENLANQVAI